MKHQEVFDISENFLSLKWGGGRGLTKVVGGSTAASSLAKLIELGVWSSNGDYRFQGQEYYRIEFYLDSKQFI